MTRRPARITTDRLGDSIVTIAVAVGLVAAAWFAGTWSTSGTRQADFERLSELARAPGLAALIHAWIAFASHAAELAACIAAVQVASCVTVVAVAWRLTRSRAFALLAGALAVASPFPEHWLARPEGFADSIAALALFATFAALLDDAAVERRRWTVGGAAFFAVLVSGWACITVLAVVAVARGRIAIVLCAAVVTAIGVRLAVGMPISAAAGHWNVFAPHATEAMRLLVAAAAATPALVFALTRPGLNLSARLTRHEWALLGAAVALALCSGFLASDAAALFAAQLAIMVWALSVAARRRYDFSLARAGVAGATVLVLGLLVRPSAFPVDDVASVMQERTLVRAVAPNFTLVDHGDSALRALYSPEHLAYIAGGPVNVRYVQSPPAEVSGPVLDAARDGLTRTDQLLRTTAALERLRRRVRFDIMASSERGTLNSRIPQATPNGLGVIPRLPVPGPNGAIESIIVLSNFSDTFENIRVEPGDRLVYLVAKALALGNSARSTVVVEIPGRRPITVVDDLPPASPSASANWILREVALPVRTQTNVRLRFAASSASQRNIGDWVAFGRPAIVAR